MFSLASAALGMRSALIDAFRDSGCVNRGMDSLDVFRSRGVNVISRDVIADGIGDLEPQSFDAITTFDSMEHWHHSPNRLFHQLMRSLNPGGVFVIGVPNCANPRKRMTAHFGAAKWTAMSEWYKPDVFRSHVRDPDVSDLRYIARDLKLINVRIIGRNWQGYGYNQRALIRAVTPLVDPILRLAPSL